uniref:Uncharacterized protein n=1 Tax=Tetranychus urticae TaxID=32264 RepID=T1KIV3_TETUR
MSFLAHLGKTYKSPAIEKQTEDVNQMPDDHQKMRNGD